MWMPHPDCLVNSSRGDYISSCTICKSIHSFLDAHTSHLTGKYNGSMCDRNAIKAYPSSRSLSISSRTNEVVQLGEHEAKQRSSGIHATLRTQSSWSFRLRMGLQVDITNIYISPCIMQSSHLLC